MNTFNSMPNFRKLTVNKENVGKKDQDTDAITDIFYGKNEKKPLGNTKVYRSSKPDLLTEHETKEFCDLNFRTIIDFRSHREYSMGEGLNHIDAFYTLCEVKLPQWCNYNAGEELVLEKISSQKQTNNSAVSDNNEEQPILNPNNPITYNPRSNNNTTTNHPTTNDSFLINEKRHILINFFNLNLIWAVFNRVSYFNQSISLLILFYDFILGYNNYHFIRFFARHSMNDAGIKGLYVDMINLSQASIYAALKLLTIPTNLPVMMNCAHGKDRTGIMSALVLSVLGYPKDHIVRDFARSAHELDPIKEQVIAETVERMDVNMSFAGAEPETMQHVLDYIDDNYGGVTSYLESIGFTIADQNLLRKNLS